MELSEYRRFAHPVLYQVVKDLRRPLNGDMVVIGEVGGPGRHRRAILHRVRHGVGKGPCAGIATGWTDFDLGAMCRDFNADSRNIEHLALFITPYSQKIRTRLPTGSCASTIAALHLVFLSL